MSSLPDDFEGKLKVNTWLVSRHAFLTLFSLDNLGPDLWYEALINQLSTG